MNDIEIAKRSYNIKNHLENSGYRIDKKGYTDRCPFCNHKDHFRIFESGVWITYSKCNGSVYKGDIITFFVEKLQMSRLQAIEELLRITNTPKNQVPVLKQIEKKKEYNFNNFYGFCVERYKFYTKRCENNKSKKMSDITLIIDTLSLKFYDKITEFIIFESDTRPELIDKIQKNYESYFRAYMIRELKKLELY